MREEIKNGIIGVIAGTTLGLALFLPTILSAHTDTSDELTVHRMTQTNDLIQVLVDTSHVEPDTLIECVVFKDGVPVGTGEGYSKRIATNVFAVSVGTTPTSATCFAVEEDY